MFDIVRRLLAEPPGPEKHRFERAALVVERLREYGLYPEFSRVDDHVNEPVVVIEGKSYLLFAANNYLSLSENQLVKDAAIRATQKYGIGPGGSRVISGNVDIIEELEERLAALTGSEACLTYPTGYMANVSVFQAIMLPSLGGLPYPKKDGVIFVDQYSHGSIFDGCALSGVRVVKFKHNNQEDLERKLIENEAFPHKLIVTEGVFCLEGEITDIPAFLNLAREYGAMLMVDDAHAVGVIGRRGGGSPDYHDCPGEIDIIMGSMDKALGGTGGYLCGSREFIEYLRVTSNASVFSSALPCSMAGAMLAALDIAEAAQPVREELAAKARYLKHKLRENGFTVLGPHDIPSVPLFIGNENLACRFAVGLREEGIYCPVMRWPAVPFGRARFRFSLMAKHKLEHLDQLVAACDRVADQVGLAR